jgi:hypothetical protein
MVNIPRTNLVTVTLPTGQWDWHFIVDDNQNTSIDATWWDRVEVTVF